MEGGIGSLVKYVCIYHITVADIYLPWFFQLVMDERYIVVDVRGKGLVIFSSCSRKPPTQFTSHLIVILHLDAGIVNVLHSATKTFPNRPIHMILGGLHLAGPELRYRVKPTVDAIASYSPDYVVPLHCTGFDAKVKLREVLGTKVVPGGVGLGITVLGVEENAEAEKNMRSEWTGQ